MHCPKHYAPPRVYLLPCVLATPLSHCCLTLLALHTRSDDPRIAKVAFTGSCATGQRVALAAAKNLRPSGLELGGKSALLVFEDADVDKAVEWAMVRRWSAVAVVYG